MAAVARLADLFPVFAGRAGNITHPRRHSGALAGVDSAIIAPACGKISFAISGPTTVPRRAGGGT
ncbi:MAG TPA: hypothetical protein VFZ72_06465 [Jiangellaceae bacterium]